MKANSIPLTLSRLRMAGLLTLGISVTCLTSLNAGEIPISPAGNDANLGTVATTLLKWDNDKIDLWNGFVRHNLIIDGRKAWVVEPKKALPGNPWTWCMKFPDKYTAQTGVLALLDKGFFHLHIDIGNEYGSPNSLKGTLKNIIIKKAFSPCMPNCWKHGYSFGDRSLPKALFYWISGPLHSLARPFHPSQADQLHIPAEVVCQIRQTQLGFCPF